MRSIIQSQNDKQRDQGDHGSPRAAADDRDGSAGEDWNRETDRDQVAREARAHAPAALRVEHRRDRDEREQHRSSNANWIAPVAGSEPLPHGKTNEPDEQELAAVKPDPGLIGLGPELRVRGQQAADRFPEACGRSFDRSRGVVGRREVA